MESHNKNIKYQGPNIDGQKQINQKENSSGIDDNNNSYSEKISQIVEFSKESAISGNS